MGNEGKLAHTVDEARGLTSIGRNELYRAIHAGEIAVIRVGRRVLIPTAELSDWIARRTSKLDASQSEESANARAASTVAAAQE